jgi:serine/threonine protein kinase
MGAVFLAHDTQLERDVALKLPSLDVAESPEFLARFYREARAAARLRHPNLCPVFDVGQFDGAHYLTMAYIEGRTLSAALKEWDEPYPERQAAEAARTLALAMAAVHRGGVVHRDLKPGNIMLDSEGNLVVTDFGLARRTEAEGEGLTKTGSVLGAPAYMAPEQVEGRVREIGPATDIYSLGVILYEMLAGRRPFEGPWSHVLFQVLHTLPESPTKFRPDLDPRLVAICLRALAKKPKDRFATMAEFAQALQGFLESEGSRTVVYGL